MENRLLVASDVSKKTLDFTVRRGLEILLEKQIANDATAIRALLALLSKKHGMAFDQTLFCMEHTGVYTQVLVRELQAAGAAIYLIHAPEIQQSGGLKRGKNDRVDAARIAEYAFRNSDKLRLFEPVRPVVEQIQHLMALRSRLQKAIHLLEVPIKEARQFLEPEMATTLEEASKPAIDALQKNLKDLDKQLEKLQKTDPEVHRKIDLVRSVPGLGKVASFTFLVATNEFTRFDSAKKLACHAGVVPFAVTSGTSVRHRPKVSHQANKKLKTILHMAALSIIRHKKPLKKYYDRKVAEGKNKMSAINALRCKIVNVMFACVRSGTMYKADFAYA